MKPFFLSFILVFIWFFAGAQKKSIPFITGKVSEEKFASSFNDSHIRLLKTHSAAAAANGINGIFVLYEEVDTLSFNDVYYEKNAIGTHLNEGIAFYSKEKNQYHLLFANSYAFFCKSCNNMQDYGIELKKDTVSLQLSWGPSANGTTDEYKFVFNKKNSRWQCINYFGKGINDAKEEHREYLVYDNSVNLYLDNHNAEEMFDKRNVSAKRKLTLYYTAGKYKELLDTLEKLPVKDRDLLKFIFGKDDAKSFFDDYDADQLAYKISKNNVVFANDIGYYFEQANDLDAAEVFLSSVIKKFPDRAVAYLNLGDVYQKKKNSALAISNYQTYISLIRKRGLQSKVPQRIVDFIQKNNL
jgi:hypothetical protein